MIALPTLAVFVGACVLLALTPGPNMSLIVANTLAGGLRAGLTTLAGASVGLAVLVCIAAAGMTSVMGWMAEWFELLRWVGALYLIGLGVRQVWGWWQSRGQVTPATSPAAVTTFAHGLLVSLSNPKVMLFLGAFLPQFVDTTRPTASQLITLAMIFWATLLTTDLIYTLALARARATIDFRRLQALDGIAGALLVVGGLLLASARRPV